MKPIFNYNGENATLNYYRGGPDHSSFQQSIADLDSISLDFALENDFSLGDVSVPEGYIHIEKAEHSSRIIKVHHKNTWSLLTISVSKNRLKALGFDHILPDRRINLEVIRILLGLLHVKKNTGILGKWIDASMNLLLYELYSSHQNKYLDEKLSWRDATIAYEILEAIKSDQHALLSKTKLTKSNEIKPYRFQKVCRQLYGSSIKEILYGQKMEEILHMVTRSDKSLEEISQLTGFNSYENFITAFKNHYDITPALLRRTTFGR